MEGGKIPGEVATNAAQLVMKGGGVTANDPGNAEPENFIKNEEAISQDPRQYIPISTVVKTVRTSLPPNSKIADDAKEAIQECVSEFISYVIAKAKDRCKEQYRKTITSQDFVESMRSLGFHNYVEPLTLYLSKYRAQHPDHDNNIQSQPALPPPPPPPMGYLPRGGEGSSSNSRAVFDMSGVNK